MNTTRRPLSPLELQLAEQFADARLHAVALTLMDTADLGPLLALHEELKDPFAAKYGEPLTLLPWFVKATAAVLKQLPVFRSHLDGEDVVETSACDLSVALDGGAPVLRSCDTLSLARIAAALAALTAKARAGKLTVPDLQGGTLSLTYHGATGPRFTTPVLRSPQSAALVLLPVGRQPCLDLALGYDARLISACAAGEFVACFRAALADPLRLLIDS
jgi:2-oxoglutarate dehydrogenase E2 component (dihydrolipoamide succinyltransferase)